jgi:hypothetical protein
MNETPLDPKKSFDIIDSIIAESQKQNHDNGFYFRLWGVLVALTSIIQYILLNAGFGQESNLVWLAMSAIGAPISIYYGYRQSKKKPEGVQSISQKIYGRVWLGFGISLIMVIFTSIHLRVTPLPFICVIVGLATFLSGRLLRFLPLTLGGVVFWACAIFASMFAQKEALLVYAASIVLGYLIPGIMLWKKTKSAHV